MINFNYLLPQGLVLLRAYGKRFANLNLPWQKSLSRQFRNALETSNIEMIPSRYRDKLQIAVDVGANVGEWSKAYALLTKVNKIIAYEPIPEVFEKLKQNTRRFKQICCKHSAIGSYVGKITLNVEKIHQLSSVLNISNEGQLLHKIEPNDAKQIETPITTLDEELANYDEISLLKIDVQGYEPEVLAGAQSIMARTKVMMIEIAYAPYYQGAPAFTDLLKLITSISPLELWGITEPHCSAEGRPIWADAIFCNDW